MNLFIWSCVVLGVLGIIMTIFSIYLILTNAKLQNQVADKERLLKKKVTEIEEQKKLTSEKEGYIVQLREQISIRDRKLSRMQRKGYGVLS